MERVQDRTAVSALDRRPCEFCATSAAESIAPSINNAAASSAQVGAIPAISAQKEATIIPATATREDRKRRINMPANKPELSAPIGPAAKGKPELGIRQPEPGLDRREQRDQVRRTAPFVRKSRATEGPPILLLRRGAGGRYSPSM
jgi:hypothetical protein